MADVEKKDRPSRDLPVPETMKIAALLAELMPNSALAVELPREDEAGVVTETVTAAAVEDLPPDSPVPPPVQRLSKSSERRITATDPPARPEPAVPEPSNGDLSWSSARPKPVPSQPVAEPPAAEVPVLPAAAPGGAFLGNYNWKNDPDFEVAAPAVDATPPPPDTDTIPIGELTAAAFFSLVNWRNHPDRGRHPRRSDFGLDDASLALAKSIPFYVIGQPRVPDKNTVASVLSEVAWE